MTAPTVPPAHAPEATTASLTVVGIDPSITATGIASSRGWCHTVGYTNKRRPFTKLPHCDRLDAALGVLRNVLVNVGRPDLAVIETPALSRTGGGAHERGWLWWEIYRHLTAAEIPIGLVSTNQRMLYATGKGTAGKSVVVDAVARRWPAWATNGDDNAADAVVLMAAGRDWAGQPICPMPKTHRAAIERATWPTHTTEVTL